MTERFTYTAADRIRAEMAKRRLSQSWLAERIGRNQAAISRRLTGQTPMTVDELVAIARALDVPVGELVGNDDGPQAA